MAPLRGVVWFFAAFRTGKHASHGFCNDEEAQVFQAKVKRQSRKSKILLIYPLNVSIYLSLFSFDLLEFEETQPSTFKGQQHF